MPDEADRQLRWIIRWIILGFFGPVVFMVTLGYQQRMEELRLECLKAGLPPPEAIGIWSLLAIGIVSTAIGGFLGATFLPLIVNRLKLEVNGVTDCVPDQRAQENGQEELETAQRH